MATTPYSSPSLLARTHTDNSGKATNLRRGNVHPQSSLDDPAGLIVVAGTGFSSGIDILALFRRFQGVNLQVILSKAHRNARFFCPSGKKCSNSESAKFA